MRHAAISATVTNRIVVEFSRVQLTRGSAPHRGPQRGSRVGGPAPRRRPGTHKSRPLRSIVTLPCAKLKPMNRILWELLRAQRRAYAIGTIFVGVGIDRKSVV